jgi:D-apionolactonase
MQCDAATATPTGDPQDLLRLYGTHEPTVSSTKLVAGELSCELEGGAIRNVQWRGVEVLRGIAYLLRDADWGTAPCVVRAVKVVQAQGSFQVGFDLHMALPEGDLIAQATVAGFSNGLFSFQVEAKAQHSLLTNRCGFVVLHPASAAGVPLQIEHTDGAVQETRFPMHISPGQVAFDIRRLRHIPLQGVAVDCVLQAELPHDPLGKFEMEDQRNWSDASFKTYVASLLDPWPYTLEAGALYKQSVNVHIHDSRSLVMRGSHDSVTDVEVLVGDAVGQRLPRMGLGVPLRLSAITSDERACVVALKPDWLLVEVDADIAGGYLEQLAQAQQLALQAGAKLQLDVICPHHESPEAVAQRVSAACELLGLEPDAVRACPAPYLKSFQPSGDWPKLPPLEAFATAFAQYFPRADIGGGMLTFFTELNRKRQSVDGLDFVGHATNPLVHAADDVSVMQTHQALESVVASVRAIWPDVPYRLGPNMLGMQRNPYGNRTAENPSRQRVAMASDDPRHQASFGAAWLAGYVAAVQDAGLALLSFHHSHGASGPALREDQPDWRPGACVPAWRVQYVLARAAGCAVLRVAGLPAQVAGIAWQDGAGHTHLLLANLSPVAPRLSVRGTWALLDVSRPCTPQELASMVPVPTDSHTVSKDANGYTSVELGPYSVVWLCC